MDDQLKPVPGHGSAESHNLPIPNGIGDWYQLRHPEPLVVKCSWCEQPLTLDCKVLRPVPAGDHAWYQGPKCTTPEDLLSRVGKRRAK